MYKKQIGLDSFKMLIKNMNSLPFVSHNKTTAKFKKIRKLINSKVTKFDKSVQTDQ